MFSSDVKWVRLGGDIHKEHYFVRSPANIKTNVPPGYHIIQDGYKFNQLNSDIFTKAINGDIAYVNNTQTIESFLSKSIVLKR